MFYDLSIGRQVEHRFLDAGTAIAKDVLSGHTAEMSDKMNQALFNGGPLDPKSFKQLSSIYDLSNDVAIKTLPISHLDPKKGWKKKPGERYGIVTIEKKISFSAILGYIEAIPFIGLAIALINCIGHSIGLAVSNARLKNASKELISTEGNKDVLEKTIKVFAQAVNYTKHCNYLVGSALSLIPFPFAKTLVRLAQGILYHSQKKTAYPPYKPAADSHCDKFLETGQQRYRERYTKKNHELSTKILSSRIVPTFKSALIFSRHLKTE